MSDTPKEPKMLNEHCAKHGEYGYKSDCAEYNGGMRTDELLKLIDEHIAQFDVRDQCSQGFILLRHSQTRMRELSAAIAAAEANKRVVEIVKAFAAEHEISCAETIYQTDRVQENATELIEDLLNEVGYFDAAMREAGHD